jgi:hypothetical protein
MSVRVKLLARKGEVRFSLKNRHGQPGLSGLKSAIFRPCTAAKSTAFDHRVPTAPELQYPQN